MFDPQVTLATIQGVLTDPEPTARRYAERNPTWQTAFMEVTLPVYVVVAVTMLVLGGVFGLTIQGWGMVIGLMAIVVAGIGLVWTFVMAFIIDKLAGPFDGEPNFDAAYACIALSIVPYAAGSILGLVPFIGWLLNIGLSIYSLVLAYKFIPIFLKVHEDSRVKHFVATIVIAFVINLVAGLIMGGLAIGTAMSGMGSADRDRSDVEVTMDESDEMSGGVLGGFERQAGFAEAAAADTFTPPGDGRLTRQQVSYYADVLAKTRALRNRLEGGLKNMENKEPSITDVFGGIGDAVRMSTADMEVVKSGGGNWAEFQWIRNQLETARIQQDLNDTTTHNYDLFQEFADEIEASE